MYTLHHYTYIHIYSPLITRQLQLELRKGKLKPGLIAAVAAPKTYTNNVVSTEPVDLSAVNLERWVRAVTKIGC